MLTLFSDVKWPLLGRYLLICYFYFNQGALNIMNLWKWSYYCLNHDGICSFFSKLKASFIAVKTHCPGKPSLFSHWMALFTCMSAPWAGPGRYDSLWWVYLRAVGFWEVLGGSVCFMDHLFLERQMLTAFKSLHWHIPEEQYQDSRSWTFGLGVCWLLKGNIYVWWYFFLLPGNHQGTSLGAKGKEERIKCDGCGTGCQ